MYKSKGMITERSQNARLFNAQENNEGNYFFKNQETTNKFEIDSTELENLMGKYKERGSDFKDLRYFEIKSVHQITLYEIIEFSEVKSIHYF